MTAGLRGSTRGGQLLRLIAVLVVVGGVFVMHGLNASAAGGCANMTMSDAMVGHTAPGLTAQATLPAAAHHSGSCTPARPRRAPIAWLSLLGPQSLAILSLSDPLRGAWERLRCAGLPPPRPALLTQLCVSLT